MYKYTFQFRNGTYACVGESDEQCAFNLMQFEHCIATGDWVTLNNRIIGQLGEYVILIEGVREPDVIGKRTKNKVKKVNNKPDTVRKNNAFW